MLAVMPRASTKLDSRPSRLDLGIPGVYLAAAGTGFVVAPFVFLALGKYQLFAISLGALLVGPYFLFIGYIALWGARSSRPILRTSSK